MLQLAEAELGGVLADDMGLGKTIQTIAYCAHLKSTATDWGEASDCGAHVSIG